MGVPREFAEKWTFTEMSMHIMIIRRALSDIAGKTLTTVETLCEQKVQLNGQENR